MRHLKWWVLGFWDTIAPPLRTPYQSFWNWIGEWLFDIRHLPSQTQCNHQVREHMELLAKRHGDNP